MPTKSKINKCIGGIYTQWNIMQQWEWKNYNHNITHNKSQKHVEWKKWDKKEYVIGDSISFIKLKNMQS